LCVTYNIGQQGSCCIHPNQRRLKRKQEDRKEWIEKNEKKGRIKENQVVALQAIPTVADLHPMYVELTVLASWAIVASTPSHARFNWMEQIEAEKSKSMTPSENTSIKM
jgi:hypothetical protein